MVNLMNPIQMSDTYVKKRLIQEAIAYIKNELETAKLAADEAKNAATDEQSIAETQYDTLAIEASYLAHGQSVRYYELKNELELLENFTFIDFDDDEEIQLGSLVTLESNKESKTLFISPAAAGFKTTLDGIDVSFITCNAPLAHAILGKYCGDETRIEIAGLVTQYEITSAS